MVQEKRQGGASFTDKDGEKIWLVLSECTGKEGKGYKHKCGETITEAKVYHPIWDGPFKCSDRGKVHVERVPYCPRCETEPDSRGAPIDVPFPGVPEKF